MTNYNAMIVSKHNVCIVSNYNTDLLLLLISGVGPILLWQFLLQSLVQGRHGICWTNEDTYEFQFTHPEAIAKAWGECKPKGKVMTYDKMCRSLRGYYKDKLLKKVPHHRFVFQFLNEKVKSICKEMQKSSE